MITDRRPLLVGFRTEIVGAFLVDDRAHRVPQFVGGGIDGRLHEELRVDDGLEGGGGGRGCRGGKSARRERPRVIGSTNARKFTSRTLGRYNPATPHYLMLSALVALGLGVRGVHVAHRRLRRRRSSKCRFRISARPSSAPARSRPRRRRISDSASPMQFGTFVVVMVVSLVTLRSRAGRAAWRAAACRRAPTRSSAAHGIVTHDIDPTRRHRPRQRRRRGLGRAQRRRHRSRHARSRVVGADGIVLEVTRA